MIEPYFQDEAVTLYQGRCEDILPGLSLTGDVHLLTDPPYFQVKDEAWDNQWLKASEFLDWMGEWLGLVKPLLSENASVWVFASPKLTSAVESVVAQQFRVLNSVRWVKPQGWHRRVELAAARSFLSPWEGIVFASNEPDNREPFLVSLGARLRGQRKASGKTARDVGRLLTGYKNPESAAANIANWELGKNLPNQKDWETYHAAINATPEPHEDIVRSYEFSRRRFELKSRELSSDVWGFDTVPPRPGKHPCEKPASLLSHMIETTTRPGDTIIDCFSGSGAVLDVARSLGRRAVGIEMDEHWCQQASKRLENQTLDFEAIA